jgi:Putative Flp pilus-assembly TadE/G-like
VRRPARGQTLVWFALTMLLLVVMVCLTLAIGMRIREKIELQTVADSVAYSNAVATARTYNTVAVWTRAQVSHLVVLAGAQSHLSFTSWYLATLNAAARSAAAEVVPCSLAAAEVPCLAPTCANLAETSTRLFEELEQAQERFRKLDPLVGAEAKAIHARASLYGRSAQAAYEAHLTTIARGGFGDAFLELAVPDPARRDEYSFNPVGSTITALELGPGGADRGALNSRTKAWPALPAALGSRRSEFIRTRREGTVTAALNAKLLTVVSPPVGIVVARPDGTAHFGIGQHAPDPHAATAAWADDEGTFEGSAFGGCAPWPIPAIPWSGTARIRSTDLDDRRDVHEWSPGGGAHEGNVADLHTLGECESDCPSVWVARPEFNLNPDDVNLAEEDQWRQPKHLVVLERDALRRSVQDPWNLLFRFRFTPSGPGRELDLRPRKQAVLSTAITYYHRHMADAGLYWQEPPNFFNPFWRATLVPPDIDQTGASDIEQVLSATHPDFARGYTRLVGAGFRGIQ